MTANKGSVPQFGETVYISVVNGTRKVKSKVQVIINKNSDPVQKSFHRGGWEDGAPTEIFPNFWNCLKRVELYNVEMSITHITVSREADIPC